MVELKVQDLRLRGRGWTLYPAAQENAVDEELMDYLVTAIYNKMGLCSGDFEKEQEILKENPVILDTISEEDFKKIYSRYGVQDLLENELVIKDRNNFILTEKSIAILKRAAELQKELDSKNFHYCPCWRCGI